MPRALHLALFFFSVPVWLAIYGVLFLFKVFFSLGPHNGVLLFWMIAFGIIHVSEICFYLLFPFPPPAWDLFHYIISPVDGEVVWRM